jgi:uncharacterized protein YegL
MPGPSLSTELDKPELDPDGDEAVCEVGIDFPKGNQQDLPLHVVFCIDVSGSMSGPPLQNAKKGGKSALDKLRPEDHYSVVAFASRSDTAINPTAADRSGIRSGERAIDNIRENDTGGGTTIHAGVEESLAQFDDMPDEQAIQWIVFLTDGSDRSFDPEAAGQEIDNAGVTAHTAGFGNYNQEKLQTTAHETNGTWKHISSPEEMPEWFQERIQNARGVVATDPTLYIEPRGADLEGAFYTVGSGEDKEPRPIETTERQSRIAADIGDLNAADPPDVYLRFDVPSTPEDESPLLLTDLTLETRVGNASAPVEAPLRPPIMQKDAGNEAIRKTYKAGEAIMKAVDEDDPDEAIQKLQDEAEDDEVIAEVVEDLENVKNSSGDAEKEARDRVSGMPQVTDDGD